MSVADQMHLYSLAHSDRNEFFKAIAELERQLDAARQRVAELEGNVKLLEGMRLGHVKHCEFLQKRVDELEEVLRSLACWISVGGYNAETVDAAEFEKRIRDGVATMIRVESERVVKAERKRIHKSLSAYMHNPDKLARLIEKLSY